MNRIINYFFCIYLVEHFDIQQKTEKKKILWKCISKHADNAYNLLKIAIFKDYQRFIQYGGHFYIL